jgi:hypothetical protein
VPRPPVTRLTIEVDPWSDPMTGVVHDGRGEQPFAGWMALVRAIEVAVETTRHNPARQENAR